MIDRIRNTVLTLLNKENRGTITPSEFNRLAGLAQRSIFEDNFYHYNRYINMQNRRMTNSEYSDIPKNIREKIDVFAEMSRMDNVATGVFEINADDVYRIIDVIYKDEVVEETPKSIITMLNKENYSQPSETYPVYTKFGNKFNIYPTTIDSDVSAMYIREPKQPRWTFLEVAGNPVFNPSATDYQDIELHPSDETRLIIKILGYCGVTIRDNDIVQIAMNKETVKDNKEQ